MAAGTAQSILVCQATADNSTVTPCSAGTAPVVMQAYVIDPANSGYFDAVAAPFDYTAATSFWFLAFSSMIILWAAAKGSGAILNFLRGR